MKVRNVKGFTLIELVLVIVIIGVLAAVAVPTFVNLTEDARRAQVQSALGNMRAAVSMAYARRAASGNATFNSAAELNANTCGVGTLYPCWQTGVPRNGITADAAPTIVASAPACPGANGCTVLEHATTDWHYDSLTGTMRPGVPVGWCTGAGNGQRPCDW